MKCDKHPKSQFNGRKCVACNREYQAKWYSENRSKQIERVKKRNKRINEEKRMYLYSILKKSKCKCGESDPAALQFDHVNRDKKITNVAKIVSDSRYTVEHLKSEIDKCQILCANCHAKKTAKDFGWYKGL